MAEALDEKLELLIMGEIRYQSSNLGLNLLISRLQKKYAAGGTTAELDACMKEMKAFFAKYKNIMAKEVAAIENL